MPSDRTKKLKDAKRAAAARASKTAPTSSSVAAPPPLPSRQQARQHDAFDNHFTPEAPTDGKSRLAHVVVTLPPVLTARQRALLHELAESHGWGHASAGDGDARRLQLGALHDPEAPRVVLDGDAPLTDEALGALLAQHLPLPPGALVAASARGAAAPSSAPHARGADGVRSTSAPAVAAAGRHYDSVDAFVTHMTRLIDLERAAEVAAAHDAAAASSASAAQARGVCLINLRVSESEGGLLGRTLLTLVPNKGYGSTPPPLLPAHKFGPHDVVALRPSAGGAGGPPLCSGLVYRVRESALVIAVDDPPDEGLEQPLRVDRLANEVTYQRLAATLRMLSGGAVNAEPGGVNSAPGLALVDVLFGSRVPRFAPAPRPGSSQGLWTPLNPGLDASQVAAVELALRAQDVALIHGPPGTGKTTAVVELVLQEVQRGTRVLAAAASNIAVDNLTERLAAAAPKLRLVRLGHPARLLPQVLDRSLEAQVLRSDNSSLARDCRREMASLHRQLSRLESWKRAERRTLRAELRTLAKEERGRQARAVQEVLDAAQVMCCTLAGALHPQLSGQAFDLVVIDEAAQALEPACWSALLKGRRAVLAGDHLQLPPTVQSEEAAAEGLACTLFERLQGRLGSEASALLTVQYRMHADIMIWSSEELYEGALEAHPAVAAHTLAGLPGALPSAAALPPLLLIDTAGVSGCEETAEAEGDSKANEGEARAALAHVQRLLDAGLAPGDIGVITPYSAQVALLRELRPDALRGTLEISTVDGFQGREKEAIVISMVRSNPTGGVGFLADARRMNVAVTRARRHVAIVADSETVSKDAFLGRLITYLEAHGGYESAAEVLEG